MKEKRCVVVTGGGQGLGHSISTAFAHHDYPVVVCDKVADRAAGVAAEIRSAGGRSAAFTADVSVEDDIVALGAFAEESFGSLGVWINNAGLVREAMLHKMAVADFDLVMDVHARGTFLGIREAARRMMASGTDGVIINVASSAGLQGTIGQINYSAAKGAVVQATKSAALELARHGIRVNAISPNAVTPMSKPLKEHPKFSTYYLDRIPMGRWAEAEEVAPSFVFLASPEAAYITGQVLCVDGGIYMAS